MTTNHHTPHAFGAPLTSAEANRPLGELDSAVAAVIATGSGAATTLTAQATAGTSGPFSVASTTGILPGDVVWFGDPGGTYESRIVNTAPSGTTFTTTANLANTYAIGKPVSKSPIELVDARGSFGTLGERLARLEGYLVAADYGATGDGTTDDTTALQAALDALPGASTGGLYIGPGTYRLTAALVIPVMTYKTIRGADWGATVLRQDTDNLAVLKTANDATAAVTIRDLQLTYLNQQTSAQTGAVALLFTAAAGAGQGWYFWRVENVRIHQAHIGLGIGGAGLNPVWGCLFERIWMTRISQSAIDFRSPTLAGMPINMFRDIQVHNTNSAVVAAAAAVRAIGCSMQFHGLDIEGWYNRLLQIDGGHPVAVRGMHVEHHKVDSAASVFEIASGPLSIEDVWLSLEVISAGVATLLKVLSGGLLTARRARLDITLTSGTVTGLSISAAGRISHLEDIVDVQQNIPLGLAQIPFVGPFNPILSTNNIAPNANQINLYAFEVLRSVRVGKCRVDINAGSGNLDVGIYDDEGNRLASSGTTAMAAGPGTQQISLTSSVLLNPGRKYYAAIVVDNATATLFGANILAGGNGSAGPLLIATRVNATYPLPASLAIAGAGAATKHFPIVFEP